MAERVVLAPVTMIVLHYTGMETGQAALDRLTSAESKVSSHYVVFEDGRKGRLSANLVIAEAATYPFEPLKKAG